MIITTVLVMNAVYHLAFNYLPGSVRLTIAGALGVLYIGLALAGTIQRNSPACLTMLLGITMVMVPWFVGLSFDPIDEMRQISSLQHGFRQSVGLFAGIAVLCYANRISPTAMMFVVIAIVASAGLHAILHPVVEYGDSIRPYSFSGNPEAVVKSEDMTSGKPLTIQHEGLHSSAYIVALCGLCVVSFYRVFHFNRVICWLVGLAAISLIFVYQVRTAQVLVIAFALTFIISELKHNGSRALFMLMSLATAFGAIGVAGAWVFLNQFGTGIFDEFSSGRLITYIERLNLLANRDPFTLLFGTGPASDRLYSASWWWETKDSHNDFLTIAIESGLIGLIGIGLFMVGIVQFAGHRAVPFVCAMVAASAISNGLISRPLIIPFMFAAIALTGFDRRKTVLSGADHRLRATAQSSHRAQFPAA